LEPKRYSGSSALVDGHRVGVRRFGSVGGWPLVWCHGGLSSALDAKLLDAAGQRSGADVIAIDRPGIGHSEAWNMSRAVASTGHYLPAVIADAVLDDLAP
jgi:pimeloyl-ACP methyl ester carboxylesterase